MSNEQQYYFNQIQGVNPNLLTQVASEGDLAELYWSLINSGQIAFAKLQSDQGREYLNTKKNIALREWYRALGMRGSAQATLMGIGDSISEGVGASSYLNRWSRQLGTVLSSKFPTTGASTHAAGYIEGATSFSPTYADFPVAYTSPWSRDTVMPPGLGTTSINISSGGKIVLTISGATSVDIFYYKYTGTGTLTWQVDAGTVNSIDDHAAVKTDFFSVRATIPDTGTHTVTVGCSAGTVGFSGFYVYNGNETKGIRVLANGRSGTPSQQYLDTATYLGQQVNALQPNAFIIELGANDYQNGTPITASAFTTKINSIISNVRANCTRPPSIILMPVWQWTPGVPPIDTWTNFVQAIYAIAAGDTDICVFDAQQRMGLQTSNDSSRGLLYTDNIHPSDGGHFMLAQSLGSFLSPS